MEFERESNYRTTLTHKAGGAKWSSEVLSSLNCPKYGTSTVLPETLYIVKDIDCNIYCNYQKNSKRMYQEEANRIEN